MRFRDFKKEIKVEVDSETKCIILKYKTYICPIPQDTSIGNLKKTLELYSNIFYIQMICKEKEEYSNQTDECWLPGFEK